MNEEEIREGDIVEIDYIAEYTKEHISEGKALVIWKGNNNQPLVRKLSTKKTIWTCYEHIARVVGHIDIEGYMDKALNVAEVDPQPKTAHWVLLDECANSGYYCSECQKKVVKEGWSDTVKKIKFCPNCGCRIVEPQESEI